MCSKICHKPQALEAKMKTLIAWLVRRFSFKLIDKNNGESAKISRPILKPLDKDRFELVEDYSYKEITIKAGYKTNGADIPRLFWAVFPPNSPEYLSAVVMHDWLCDEAESLYRLGSKAQARSEFKFADETLREMMSALGCSKVKTNIFYCACRAWHRIRYGG